MWQLAPIFALALSLTDGRGRPVDVTAEPQRIVSCALAADETLVALLSRAGQLHRLAAVSTLADDARLSHIAPVPGEITGRCGGELESVVALRPDLVVVASFNRPELLQRLEGAGIRTYVLGAFDRLDDIEAHVAALGRLAHVEAPAQALVAELRARRARVAATPVRLPDGRRPALLHVFADGATSGVHTLFDDLAQSVGAVNALAPLQVTGWPHLGAEAAAMLRVDAIVAGGDEGDRPRILAMLRAQPGLKELAPVKEGRLILVKDRNLGAASESLIDGLEELREGLAKAMGEQQAKAR